MQVKQFKVFIFIICSLIISKLTACKDSNRNSNIPLVEVNFYLQINDPAYINLNTVGGWEYLSGGSRGIIVYRSSPNEFKAYDRHCTFQPTQSCALVSVDVNNITATDDCCGSTFILTDGSVTNPPAAYPLKAYQTYFDGTTLYISN